MKESGEIYHSERGGLYVNLTSLPKKKKKSLEFINGEWFYLTPQLRVLIPPFKQKRIIAMITTVKINNLTITGDSKEISDFQGYLLTLEEKTKDSIRMDWLASVRQNIGNVQLPTKCVENNLTSLRGAIDDAMELCATEKG